MSLQSILGRILVVEDESFYFSALEKFLKKDFNVTLVASMKEGLYALSQGRYDVGLIDLKLPDGSGLDLIERAQKLQPHLATIAMTGHGSPQMALQAIQKGAFHYLTPCEKEEIKLIKFDIEEILFKYYQNFRELSAFLKIHPDDNPFGWVLFLYPIYSRAFFCKSLFSPFSNFNHARTTIS